MSMSELCAPSHGNAVCVTCTCGHTDILCGAAKQALDKIFPATDDHIGCFNTTTPIQ